MSGFVIAYPANRHDGSDTYDIGDIVFDTVNDAITHANNYQAEWVDYFVLPLGEPAYTYTWDDLTGSTTLYHDK